MRLRIGGGSMPKKTKEQKEFEAHWKQIQQAIGTCAAAYDDLVAAADKLAEITGLAQGAMLDECQPGGHCRDLLRVLTKNWDKSREDYFQEWRLEWRVEQREALFQRLKLTDEERELLLWFSGNAD